MKTKQTVEVGQIWEDCDKRCRSRQLKVVHVGQTHAECECYYRGKARIHKIRLDRFKETSTGYRLIG